jgi:methionyl-tRNA formyltransferase
MIWWAEPDSPAAREILARATSTTGVASATGAGAANASAGASANQSARARRDAVSIAADACAIPRRAKPAPGEILSLAPLVVATADGALELTRVEWRGAPAEPLRAGQVL